MEAVRILLSLVLFSQVTSYSSGPPESACRHATPQHRPYSAVNQTEICPYLVDFTAFTPGVPQSLNITSWSGLEPFKGYQLTVFDESSRAVGTFGASERTICQGAAATHREGSNKLSASVLWTPPANSSGQLYYIWLTIVKDYSKFWVNCDRVILPAIDAPELTLSTTTSSSTSSTQYSTSSPQATTARNGTHISTTQRQKVPDSTDSVNESKMEKLTTTKPLKATGIQILAKQTSSSAVVNTDMKTLTIYVMATLLWILYVY